MASRTRKDAQSSEVALRELPLHKQLFARMDPSRIPALKLKMPAALLDKEGRFAFPDLKKVFDDLRTQQYHPDRRRLSSVADFFRYTEEEGARRVWVWLAHLTERNLSDIIAKSPLQVAAFSMRLIGMEMAG